MYRGASAVLKNILLAPDGRTNRALFSAKKGVCKYVVRQYYDATFKRVSRVFVTRMCENRAEFSFTTIVFISVCAILSFRDPESDLF